VAVEEEEVLRSFFSAMGCAGEKKKKQIHPLFAPIAREGLSFNRGWKKMWGGGRPVALIFQIGRKKGREMRLHGAHG